MTDLDRIMLGKKYTILFARRGETIARECFALNAKEAIENALYANEKALVSCIFVQDDDGVSIVNLSEVLGANHAAS